MTLSTSAGQQLVNSQDMAGIKVRMDFPVNAVVLKGSAVLEPSDSREVKALMVTGNTLLHACLS